LPRAAKRAEKPGGASSHDNTRMSSGSSPFSERSSSCVPRGEADAAVKDTTWPEACTPASVRPAAARESAARGSERTRDSASSSCRCTLSPRTSGCSWKPAYAAPSYASRSA
jgi:hypothetical protein